MWNVICLVRVCVLFDNTHLCAILFHTHHANCVTCQRGSPAPTRDLSHSPQSEILTIFPPPPPPFFSPHPVKHVMMYRFTEVSYSDGPALKCENPTEIR